MEAICILAPSHRSAHRHLDLWCLLLSSGSDQRGLRLMCVRLEDLYTRWLVVSIGCGKRERREERRIGRYLSR